MNVCLDDGDERGLVLVDCDAIFEFVFEEVAEIKTLRGGEHAASRFGDSSWRERSEIH